MISTLLVDLDDTLLVNNTEVFVPAYLNKLSQYLDPIVPAEKMIYQLYVGTQAMINNRDLDKTLAEIFDANFFPFLDVSREDLISRIDLFYEEEFKKLNSLTQPISSAERLISFAIENQYEIVIATNPLFPLTAIEQRLKWAELPADHYPFALITSYETFHFAKPKLEYVAEILAKLGRTPHEAVMIGNDLALDLPPAVELGSAAFHVAENSEGPYPHGNLHDAIQWIQDSPSFPDPASCTTPDALLARLRGNLITFIELQNYVKYHQWQLKPSSDDWAPIEVLTHLRDVEKEINLPRVERILKEDTPFLSTSDSDRWAEERNYIHASPDDVYDDLIHTRRQTLTLLENQSPDAWQRPTRHAIFGPTQLSEIVRIFLEHDALHIRQIREIVAALEAIRS
jgi:FMN phosphatase YigB (HAD superfamily)